MFRDGGEGLTASGEKDWATGSIFPTQHPPLHSLQLWRRISYLLKRSVLSIQGEAEEREEEIGER